ncbi:hypothetical protein Tco_1384673 [Tanacetum coccineum]
MTRSRPSGTSSRDPSRIRSRSPGRDRPRHRDHLRNIEESHDGIYSSQGTRTKYRGPPRDRRRSRSTRRWRENESPSSRGSESSTSDTCHWKTRGKRRKTLEEDLAVPWSCEDVDPFTPRIHNFRSSRKTRMPNNVKTYEKNWRSEDPIKGAARTPKEIFAAESEKFKPPPPMNSSIEELPWHRVTRQKVTLSFAQVNEITFPPLSANKGTEGPFVIEAEIGGHAVHRMYVDGGSQEILYEHCFNRIWPKIKSQMVPATTSLTGFSGETIWPLGKLRLLVTIGDAKHFTKAWMNFRIVRLPSPYNDIIRRPGIREIQAVPSTTHGMLKFLVNGGVVTIRSTILTPNECATITAPLGGTISIEGRTTLCALLKRNLDIFAWHPSDMTGVPRQIAKHRLNIHDGYPQVRQKKRGQVPEQAKAIQAKVQKLVKVGIMREVYYHYWLSNPVMVKKHDGSWRMCMDFTNLNKAYPKDCYPLSKIDWKVESLCGYPFKCFLNAYKGYHQIQMAELDEEKMAFHTPHRVYCYIKMSFGLKNAGATYQRLVDKAFEK